MKKAIVLFIAALVLPFTPPAASGQGAAEPAATHNPADETSFRAEDGVIDIQPEEVPLSQASDMPVLPMPVASGGKTVANRLAEIDVSNTDDGYIMVRYLKKVDKRLKVIVKGPGGAPYIYNLSSGGNYDVFPLSEGNGYYQVTVYENITGKMYSTVLETTQSVRLTDEFAPFIRPNQYVNYSPGSEAAKKAAELTKSSKNTTGKIAAIYNYVIENVTYDNQLAASVKSGYLPDVDKVLKSGKGICFDYAALMTAMLRSQGIPAKLVVGYRGQAYHAWISAYSMETGWVDGVIYFDGKNWKLIDPTFASGLNNSGISKYIGNANDYSAKYFY